MLKKIQNDKAESRYRETLEHYRSYGEKTSGDHHPERPSVVYDGHGLIPRLLSFPPLFIIFSSNLIYLLSANIG